MLPVYHHILLFPLFSNLSHPYNTLTSRPDEDDFEDTELEVVTSGRIGRTVPKGATNITRPFSLDADRDRDRDRGDDVEDKNTIIAGTYCHIVTLFIFFLYKFIITLVLLTCYCQTVMWII